jgi:hypothetical protein
VLMRNLDWRKTIVLKNSQNTQRPIFIKRMQKKYDERLKAIQKSPDLDSN